MTNKSDKVMISIAWPYANGDLHLGHPAGYLISAAILSEYFRLKGKDVLMMSGSDMHGTPVAVGAWKKGQDPHDYAMDQHRRHMKVMELLGLKYTLYTNTATKNHEKVVQEIFKRLDKNGFIIKKQTEQYWSEKEHKFLLDRYIEGECPYCHYQGARGDQCDNCGRTLTPDELINPYSIFGDKELEKRQSTNYYLDLGKLQPLLEERYKNHPGLEEWRKHVWATTKAWLDEGLQPRAITRDMEGYGVQLPLGYEIEGEEGKVIYVWFEAVIGYFSASVGASVESGKYGEGDSMDNDFAEIISKLDLEKLPGGEFLSYMYEGQSLVWEDYWLDEGAKTYHFMGKDNIPFHAIIWTAMLLGLNEGLGQSAAKLNLPWNIPANQYLNLKGGKFSKSKGNIIDTREFIERFGLDAARFYLTTRMPENKDYDFTWEEFVEANNNELVANLGNLVNRTFAFWNKAFGDGGDFDGFVVGGQVMGMIDDSFKQISDLLEKCRFVDAFQQVMELSSFGNKYFNDSEIWTLVKDPADEAKMSQARQHMLDLLQIIPNLALLSHPFLPDFSKGVYSYLGLKIPDPKVGKDQWKRADFDVSALKEIKDLKPLITKLDPDEIIPGSQEK